MKARIESTNFSICPNLLSGEVPFIEIDEDWAQQKNDDDNENPLHIIAPPKAYQSHEKKVTIY
jgi:hypothetical protein